MQLIEPRSAFPPRTPAEGRHWLLARFGAQHGFTLAELMIVVGVVGALSAIALPGLRRAWQAANESAAIGSIRAIHQGQASYAATCGSGLYAPSLNNLATPPPGSSAAFIGPGLNRDNIVKSGYRIRFRRVRVPESPPSCNGAAAGSLAGSYFVHADPIQGGGSRHFGSNQLTTIYESLSVVEESFNGPPPPPAVPVQ